jgi:hypothetical protein
MKSWDCKTWQGKVKPMVDEAGTAPLYFNLEDMEE